ncbi:MAG: hypothetical protein JSU75_09335 [Gammaproteobacteria bacterium]|nr:MAG: hypothetical protein JSU75_09335 [Gammaproteobacteria bacterium]
MFTSAANVEEMLNNFRLEGSTFRYSSFVPRLYNYVRSLGFKPGKMLPSRAFCSDENQGYPIIVLTKHFGTFPFNHGRGGAVVATYRHAPYAEHGEGLVIIQASHVGYEPENNRFGTYSRIHTKDNRNTPCCGKLAGILDWYQEQYRIAQADILLERCNGELCLRIDNGLLRGTRKEGLFLRLKRLVRPDAEGKFTPLHTRSTAKSFLALEALQRQLADLDSGLQEGQRIAIGDHLKPDMFYFRRSLDETVEGRNHQELSLMYPMPWIVTSPWPLLTAAQINTQIEFDRTLRTVAHAHCFRDKCVFYISGLNIDISPQPGDPFPTTKFVPWAAYLRDRKGGQRVIEQSELVSLLREQSKENPDQIDLDKAFRDMAEAESVEIREA